MSEPTYTQAGGRARPVGGRRWSEVARIEGYPGEIPAYQIIYLEKPPRPRFIRGDMLELEIPGQKPVLKQVALDHGPCTYRLE